MADFMPNPELLVAGKVTSVRERTDFNTKAPKGRIVQLLTRTGFLEVRVPLDSELEVQADESVLWAVDFNQWSMKDKESGELRSGVAITHNRSVSDLEFTALASVAAGVPA